MNLISGAAAVAKGADPKKVLKAQRKKEKEIKSVTFGLSQKDLRKKAKQHKRKKIYVMTSELYKRSLYLNKNIDYLFGVDICEYDIESAGLNIIKYYGLLPQDRITYLEGMSKEARNKQIGIYQRDDSVFKEALSEGFVNIRKEFFELNEIEDDDILSIKKDAIFTLDRRMRHTKIGNVT